MRFGSSTVGGRPASSAAAALAALVLASACGGSDDGGRVAAPEICAEQPGVTAEEIRVGGIYPTSGPNGPFFGAVGAGIEARFDAENDRGGVGGRRLRLAPADDGDGELSNLNAARHLVVEEPVFGIIEVSTSADGSGEYLVEEGVPVTGWAISSSWGRYRNMFGYRHSTSPEPGGEPVTRTARFIRAHGGRRVAVIAGGAAASVNVAEQLVETLPAFGLELGYKTTDVQLGDTDFAVHVRAMERAGVDTLYTGMATAQNIALHQAVSAAGLQLDVVLFPAGYDSRLAETYGDELDGIYVAVDWRPFELPVPAHARFREHLAAVAPDEFPGQLAMVGWLSADAFVRGLREAGARCPTREAFIRNLRTVDDHTADGLLPVTDFDAEFGRMPRCFFYVQLDEGRFRPVDDEPFCGELLEDLER